MNSIKDIHNMLNQKQTAHSKLDFYLVEIIARRKDNPGLPRDAKKIKSYFVSLEELLLLEDKIIELCEKNNARAYIYINRRNKEHVAKKLNAYIAGQIARDDYGSIHQATYNSIAAQYSSESKDDRRFIIDVDKTKDRVILNTVVDCYRIIRLDESPVVVNPTVNGFHILARPFDTVKFIEVLYTKSGLNTEFIQNIEIMKDGMILLYFPDQAND